MLLVFAGACATLGASRPSPPHDRRTALPRTLKVQVRHGGSPAVVTVAARGLRGGDDLSEVDPPRGRHEGPRAHVRGAGGAHAHLCHQPSRPARRARDSTSALRPTASCTSRTASAGPSGARSPARPRRGRPADPLVRPAPARAVFHADCGGHTSASSDGLGRRRPQRICRAPPTMDPARGSHMTWTFDASRGRCATRSMRIRARVSDATLQAHRHRRHATRPAARRP